MFSFILEQPRNKLSLRLKDISKKVYFSRGKNSIQNENYIYLMTRWKISKDILYFANINNRGRDIEGD